MTSSQTYAKPADPTSPLPFRQSYHPQLHPRVREVEARTLAWLHHHRLIEGRVQEMIATRAKFAHLAARTYPNASLEALQLYADWLAWLFYYDDVMDRSSASGLSNGRSSNGPVAAPQIDELDANLYSILRRESVVPLGPLDRSFSNLMARFQGALLPSSFERLCRKILHYFQGTAWELTHRHLRIRPSLEHYRQVRHYSSAVETCFALIAALEGVQICDPELEHPVLVQAAIVANCHISWVNDVVGHRKEQAEPTLNLVKVLAQERNLPLAQAVAEATRLCESQLACYEHIRLALPPWLADDWRAVRLLRTYEDWMFGHVDWCRDTGRYAGAADGARSQLNPSPAA